MDRTDQLTKECILFAMDKIKDWIKSLNYPGETKYLCECMEILSRAYQNINTNNEKQEANKND